MQPDPEFTIGGIPITDWVQAIGALIAIIASIYGFFKLFMRDKDRQDQLESLKNLAQQSTLQTGQLFSHTLHMEESNKLFREQIQVFKERLILDKTTQEQREKESEIERKMRKNDILPIFNQTNGHGTNEHLKIDFSNKGGQGKIINAEIIEADSLRIDQRLFGKIVARGEEFQMIVRSTNSNMNANNTEYKMDLIFENIDGDKFKQRFNCSGIICKSDSVKEHDKDKP